MAFRLPILVSAGLLFSIFRKRPNPLQQPWARAHVSKNKIKLQQQNASCFIYIS